MARALVAIHNIVLAEKIRLLFHHGTDDSKLVALLLSTRVEDDTEFLQLLVSSITMEWMEWLLDQQQRDGTRSSFSRLLAQILCRCVEADTKQRKHALWIDAMGPLLVKHYDDKSDECLLALQTWLEYCRKSKIVDEVLCQFVHSNLLQGQVPEQSDDEDKNINDDEADDTNTDDQLLQSTLRALLDQTRGGGDAPLHGSDNNSLIVRVFVRSATRVVRAGRVPRFFAPLLSSWLSTTVRNNNKLKASSRDHRVAVAQTLLQTAQCFTASTKGIKKIDNKGIIQLLLACVVSTEELQLHSMGWSTLVSLVQHLGWEWLFLESDKKLGRATFLCTFVRMAAGECKIQMAWLLEEESTKAKEQALIAVLEVCTHFLVQVIEFLTELEEKDCDFFSGDAILHIQRSLEETMTVTAEYLVLCKEPSIFSIRLFGSLLTEFDAFRVGRTGGDQNGGGGLGHTPEDENDENVLPALRVVLEQHAKDDDFTHGYVLRGVLAVLESAQGGDDKCVQMLKDEGLNGDVLTQYIIHFFLTFSSGSTATIWACKVLEHQYEYGMGVVTEIGALQEAIICCLERMLVLPSTKEVSAAVAHLVSVYVMFQGDTPPDDERTAVILQRSFDIQQAIDLA